MASTTPNEIVVTIEGPVCSAKSRIAESVQEALSHDGAWVIPDPGHGAIYPSSYRSNEMGGVIVRIVEMQTGVPVMGGDVGVA